METETTAHYMTIAASLLTIVVMAGSAIRVVVTTGINASRWAADRWSAIGRASATIAALLVLATLLSVTSTVDQLQKKIERLTGEVRVQSGTVGIVASDTRSEDPDIYFVDDLLTPGNRESPPRGVVDGRVVFPQRFASTPAVTVGIRKLVIDHTRPIRVTVEVTSVDAEGFDYRLFTWHDTALYDVLVSWMAVAKQA